MEAGVSVKWEIWSKCGSIKNVPVLNKHYDEHSYIQVLSSVRRPVNEVCSTIKRRK